MDKYAVKWSDGDYKYFDTEKDAQEYVDRNNNAYRRCDMYGAPVLIPNVIKIDDTDICDICHTPTMNHLSSDISQCDVCKTVRVAHRESLSDDEPRSTKWYDRM